MKKVLVTLSRDEVIRIQYNVTYYMCRNVTRKIMFPQSS